MKHTIHMVVSSRDGVRVIETHPLVAKCVQEPGLVCLSLSPNYKCMKRAMQDSIEAALAAGATVRGADNPEMRFPNGSRLLFKTVDSVPPYKTLHGYELHHDTFLTEGPFTWDQWVYIRSRVRP